MNAFHDVKKFSSTVSSIFKKLLKFAWFLLAISYSNVTTSNKVINKLGHIKSLLKIEINKIISVFILLLPK